ncbi:MAG: glucose 1-dehydrogenase [Gammaproteobacteria bacterium]|nr:glucose 1-dehydrogenase [Gammaproteobacteria bacterium]
MLAIDLSGRVALVTGAGRGIGFAIASVLRDCGARVVINDRGADEADRAAAALGSGTIALAGDIADEDVCDALPGRCVAAAGRYDILVNNAGVAAQMRRTVKQSLADWQRTMDVNVRGTFLMSRAAARHFTAARSGCIVNIASVAGLGAIPASNDYSVSKAAIAMMTRTMAADLGRVGVRVNCVAPGFCDAPMLHGLLAGDAEAAEANRRRIPLGRFGEPAEIGHAVAFLCSDLARYMTGAVVAVDGGWLANGGA